MTDPAQVALLAEAVSEAMLEYEKEAKRTRLYNPDATIVRGTKRRAMVEFLARAILATGIRVCSEDHITRDECADSLIEAVRAVEGTACTPEERATLDALARLRSPEWGDDPLQDDPKQAWKESGTTDRASFESGYIAGWYAVLAALGGEK